MKWFCEYKRPGEKFCRFGSDDGYDNLEIALHHLREAMRTAVAGSVVRVVDAEGKRVASMEGAK